MHRAFEASEINDRCKSRREWKIGSEISPFPPNLPITIENRERYSSKRKIKRVLFRFRVKRRWIIVKADAAATPEAERWLNERTGRVSNLRIPYCATCIARLFYSGAGYIHACLYSVLDEKRTSDIFYPLSVGKIIRIERPLTLYIYIRMYTYIFIRINWNFVWLWEIEIRYRIFGNYRRSEGIN